MGKAIERLFLPLIRLQLPEVRDIEFVMGPGPEEGFTRPWPDVIEMSPEIKRRVDELWTRAGL